MVRPMSRKKMLVLIAAGAVGAVAIVGIAVFGGSESAVKVDDTTHLQCIECGYQYRLPPEALPADFRDANSLRVKALDCPKCAAKASVYPDVNCVKCGAWTVMPWHKHPESRPANNRWDAKCDKCGAPL
jgi:hypothetical protein